MAISDKKTGRKNGINTTIVYAEMSSSSVFKESFRPENVKLNVLILVSSKSSALNQDTKNRILDIASKVLGKKYTTLDLRTVDKRRLFVVDRKEKHYSGFNMGAGENAVFSLLIELFSAGKNTLLVIDEIELGLHESAQKRLIQELKELCLELHCQIICSTHSSTILDLFTSRRSILLGSNRWKNKYFL